MICDDLTPNMLGQYLKKELSVKECDLIALHIGNCSSCAQKCDEIRSMLDQLSSESSWNQREQVNFQYQERESGGVMAKQNDIVSITDDYLRNQETLGEQITTQMKKAPWWLLSLTLNGILLLLTTMIIIGRAKEKEPENIIQAELPPKQEPEYEPETKRDLKEEQKEIPKTDPKVVEKSEVEVPENVEVSDHMEADTQSDFNEMAEADLDNQMLSDKSGDIGKFTGLGAGGGSGGAFGQRGRGGRRWLVKRGGGSTKTESAMEAALLWLKRHQSLEIELGKGKGPENDKGVAGDLALGLWLEYNWYRECSSYKGKNKGGQNNNRNKFPGICPAPYKLGNPIPLGERVDRKTLEEHYTNGGGSLVILAYAGAGYTHKRGKFRTTVKRWLNTMCVTLDQAEKADKKGYFVDIWGQDFLYSLVVKKLAEGLSDKVGSRAGAGKPMYQHAIMALAINEMYGVSRDAYLKKYALSSTEALLQARSSVNGAWKYQYVGGKNYSSYAKNGDLSVATWSIMAIKAAKAVGIINEAAKKCRNHRKTGR